MMLYRIMAMVLSVGALLTAPAHARVRNTAQVTDQGASASHYSTAHVSPAFQNAENTESFHYKYEDESGHKKEKKSKSTDKKDTDPKDLKKSVQRIHYEDEGDELRALKEQDPTAKRTPNTKVSLLKGDSGDVSSADVLLHHIDHEYDTIPTPEDALLDDPA